MDETSAPSMRDAYPPADVPRMMESEPDLRPFADQLIAIAEQLRLAGHPGSRPVTKIGGDDADHAPPVRDFAPPRELAPPRDILSSPQTIKFDLVSRRQQYANMARDTYAQRRKRAVIFGNQELFGEPAWDILLDLYIAFVDEKPVSVSSACIGSAAPPTTGLRWLGVLAEQDLVLREHDPQDQRRVLVRLTEKGLAAMDRYFESACQPA